MFRQLWTVICCGCLLAGYSVSRAAPPISPPKQGMPRVITIPLPAVINYKNSGYCACRWNEDGAILAWRALSYNHTVISINPFKNKLKSVKWPGWNEGMPWQMDICEGHAVWEHSTQQSDGWYNIYRIGSKNVNMRQPTGARMPTFPTAPVWVHIDGRPEAIVTDISYADEPTFCAIDMEQSRVRNYYNYNGNPSLLTLQYVRQLLGEHDRGTLFASAEQTTNGVAQCFLAKLTFEPCTMSVERIDTGIPAGLNLIDAAVARDRVYWILSKSKSSRQHPTPDIAPQYELWSCNFDGSETRFVLDIPNNTGDQSRFVDFEIEPHSLTAKPGGNSVAWIQAGIMRVVEIP